MPMKLLTVEQVAEILNCEYQKAYCLFRSNDRLNPFKSFRIGRVWYIKENDFEKWVNKKAV